MRREDPPAAPSWHEARARWDAVAEQLRAEPGVWFVVLEDVSSSSYAAPLHRRGLQTRVVTLPRRRGAKRRFNLYAKAAGTE